MGFEIEQTVELAETDGAAGSLNSATLRILKFKKEISVDHGNDETQDMESSQLHKKIRSGS